MYQVTGQFQVDTDKLNGLEIQDPYSTANLAIFKSGQLSSTERLYFSLLSSPLLSSVSFKANSKLLTLGQELSCAYLVVKGELLSIQNDQVQRLGPGSVLGLAEGLSGMPYNKTIVAVSAVQARVIPLHKVDSILPKLPLIMRKIIQTTAKRTLTMTDEPRDRA
jgi:CRP-like cAMP-binding protein